jgi:hypothetical protein
MSQQDIVSEIENEITTEEMTESVADDQELLHEDETEKQGIDSDQNQTIIENTPILNQPTLDAETEPNSVLETKIISSEGFIENQIKEEKRMEPDSDYSESEEEEIAYMPKITIIHSDLKKWENKRYMGGFRNKKTGKEYFHTMTQTRTAQDAQAENRKPANHRDTQTIYISNDKTQTVRENGTQMVYL